METGWIVTRLSGSVASGQHPWEFAAFFALIAGLSAAWFFERAGHHVVAILATALTGLLVSPISWDHHWVWVAPGVATAGHYAIKTWKTARSNADRWRARGLGVLAAFMIFIYAASKTHPALWATVTVSSVLGILALSLLEIFVAFLQAYIFTFLASLFMGMALHPAH